LITVYHGSNALFDRPDLGLGRNRRDFGSGFYTTTLRSQAEDWARSVTERFGGEAYLYVFEFDLADDLSVQAFSGISLEWLDMVKANRMRGGVQHDFDVVIGPVANDNTVRTVSLYVAGVYDAEEAMRRLRYFKANDQVSIHTKRAMARLELKGREHV
jgi:hypothetical protein